MFRDAPVSVNNWAIFSELPVTVLTEAHPQESTAKVPGSVVPAHRNLGLPSRTYRPCLGLAVKLAKLTLQTLIPIHWRDVEVAVVPASVFSALFIDPP